MFKQALLPDTFRALQLVAGIPVVQAAYLAGGTALALRLGHRISVDLDFFTLEKFDESLVVADLNKQGLADPATAWMTVKGKIGQTDFSLFHYQYPIIDLMDKFEGVNILGEKDIAAMKIHTLADRGTRRDFVDVFFLAKRFSFEEMMDFYDQKYGDLEDKRYHIVRSLNYFADAETEQRMPKMLVDLGWEQVKSFFDREALRLAKSKLGV